MSDKYTIYSRNRDGSMSALLNNINSARIIERVNEPGSWTVKARTKENSPFIDGQGIVVVKDGIVYYTGVGKSLSETYDAYTDTYEWAAEGASDIDFLARRVCYPDPNSGSFISQQYYTDEGLAGEVVQRLVDRNLGVDALTERREPIIDSTQVEEYGRLVSVSLRFENLLKVIQSLLESQGQTIRAVWDKETGHIHFRICASEDLTQRFVFSTELNTILEYTLLDEAPDANVIIGETEINDENIVRTVVNNDSVINWGRIETFTSSSAEIVEDLESEIAEELFSESENKTGYSTKITPLPNVPQYKRDWNLGDEVKFVISGQVLDAKVLQVETVINHEKAIVVPTIGTVYNGKFADIYKSIKEIRADIARIRRR